MSQISTFLLLVIFSSFISCNVIREKSDVVDNVNLAKEQLKKYVAQNPNVINVERNEISKKFDHADCVNQCIDGVTVCTNCANDIFQCVTSGDCADPGSEKCVVCASIAATRCLGCFGAIGKCVKTCESDKVVVSKTILSHKI